MDRKNVCLCLSVCRSVCLFVRPSSARPSVRPMLICLVAFLPEQLATKSIRYFGGHIDYGATALWDLVFRSPRAVVEFRRGASSLI